MTVGSQLKQCVASIKHIEASLEELQLKTMNSGAKQAYKEAHTIISNTKQTLENQLTHIQLEEEEYN